MQVNRSFSQLSISQENTKKKKIKTRNNQSNNELLNVMNGDNTQEKKKEENHDESVSMNYMQNLKPHYLKVSDQIFKQMLSTAIKDSDKIVQSLDTNEKLQFVRHLTEVTNNLHYIDLQRHLWQDYYNLGMKEGVWAPQLSKYDAKQLNTCRTYGFPKHIIEKRQKQLNTSVTTYNK